MVLVLRRRNIAMKTIVFTFLIVLITPSITLAKTHTKEVSALNIMGKALLKAIKSGSFVEAKKLLPTIKEIAKLGDKPSKKKYSKFLKQRKNGFNKIVKKFKKKLKGYNCKKITFSKIKLGRRKTKGALVAYSSMDLFAKCDSKEIWVADPDGLIKFGKKWKLMEFD
jgi:hypothetical protein